MDGRRVTLLALFDVSAAFDTVDHEILIKRLSISFGLADRPLDWITSFLAGRSSSVVVGASRSPWALTPFGLPQGSVLAPLLYLLYTSNIGTLLSSYGVLSQLYADDIQSSLRSPRRDRGCPHHAAGDGGPRRLDVLEPAPPQRPKNPFHLVGHQATAGQARPKRSLS